MVEALSPESWLQCLRPTSHLVSPPSYFSRQYHSRSCSSLCLAKPGPRPSVCQVTLPRLRFGLNGKGCAGRHNMSAWAFAGTDELAAYISDGPLNSLAGITPDSIKKNIDQWQDLGALVAKNLEFGSTDKLDEVQKMRIFHLYLPIFFWIRAQLDRHRSRQSAANRTPLMLGMSAPQGCGKTTLVEQLESLFAHTGGKAAVFSMDDCYLTRSDQEALAKEFPDNGLFQVRGNAGTHDLQLGKHTLQALQKAGAGGAEVRIPKYDKAANSGKGDRADASTWETLKGPVDVVLFEGWMLGFRELPTHDAFKANKDLVEVNDRLRQYVNAWDTFMDAWLVLKVTDPKWVYNWREQAEQSRRAGGSGMNEQEVVDFVDRYMPAYLAYLPSLYARGPTTAQPGRLLMVEVDEHRALAKQQPKSIK